MKFRIKIMFCMVALLALLFGIGGSMLIYISFTESLDHEKERAKTSYQMAIQTLQVLDSIDEWVDQEAISHSLENGFGSDAVLWSSCRLNMGGSILYSQGEQKDFVILDEPSEVANYVILNVSGTDRKQYLQLSGTLKIGNNEVYLDMLYDVSTVYQMREQQLDIYYRIFAVMLGFCVLFAWVMSWMLTRSLAKLSKAAKEIADGNLSYRSGVQTRDEIGMLSRDFDHMAEQVETSMEKIRSSMERQEQFMGSFAHELKTPMTSIIGYADLMRGQTLTPQEEQEAANYIFSEGKRLENMSWKLLSLFRMDGQEIVLAPGAPGEVMEQLAEHLRPIYQGSGIEIVTDCERGKCLLEPDLFQTLLLNLMDNARKAMAKGGRLTLNCYMTEDGCEIQVIDTGCGIPKEALGHLTEAFYRVDKSRSRAMGGVGLGLTLCDRIIKLHRGEMEIISEAEQGTVISVWLRGGRV